MNSIAGIRFRKITRPLRTVFCTSLGSKSVATSVLIEVSLAAGEKGIGEVPTSFAVPHETPEAIKTVLAEARGVLEALPIEDYSSALAVLRGRFGEFHMTLSGLEVAMFRAALAARGQSEPGHWNAFSRSIETDITVAFTRDRKILADWVRRSTKIGFKNYKIKVSGDIKADIALVKAVREELDRMDEGAVIRLDGNQGYTAETYRWMLDELDKANITIELFEQPLARDDFAGLRRIAGHTPTPVILDETVFDAQACRRVIDEGLGDGVNIKIAKSGIAESVAIMKLAREAGLKLMIGCMTETMVGLSVGIYMAAGTGAFDYVDLDAAHLLFNVRRQGAITIVGQRYVISGLETGSTKGVE